MSVLLAAKVWYFWDFFAAATLFPFLNVYFKKSGLTAAQVGVLAAVRPWIAALSGNLWAGLADHIQAHQPILILAFVATTVLRYSIRLVNSFPLVLLVLSLSESTNAPIIIITDAAVMAFCGPEEGHYGKIRLWGSAGNGLGGPIAGAFVHIAPPRDAFDPRDAFFVNAVCTSLCFIPTLLLPTWALREKQRRESKGRVVAELNEPNLQQHDSEVGDISPLVMHISSLEANSPDKAGEATEAAPQLLAQAIRTRPASEHGAEQEPSSPLPAIDEDLAMAFSCEDALLREVELHIPITTTPELQVFDRQSFHYLTVARNADYSSSVVAGTARSSLGSPPRSPLLSYPTSPQATPFQGGPATPWVGPEVWGYVYEPLLGSAAEEASLKQKLVAVFTNSDAMVFLLSTVLRGYGLGIIDGYLFLYLDSLGGTTTLMGLTVTMTSIAEVPVFFYTGALLRRLGVDRTLSLVLGALILRMACYTGLPLAGTPWAVLPVELLHGITFGCSWAAGTVQSARLAPPGFEATMQAIFQGAYMGIGNGLGALAGGMIYRSLGLRAVFAISGGVLALGWALCSGLSYFIKSGGGAAEARVGGGR